MPKRQIKLTDEKVARWISEGRGQGEGADYTPWIQIGEVSSRGRSHRIKDHKNGRVHHLLSDLEKRYYYIAAWSDRVIDIREQFPLLPRSNTEAIAAKLGYANPKAPSDPVNLVMTSDFLLTVQDEAGTHYEARHVKYSDDIKKPRTIEKYEIEKAYWVERGIPIKVVTEQSINGPKANNIEFLLGFYSLDQVAALDCGKVFRSILLSVPDFRYLPVSQLGFKIDNDYLLEPGTGLSVFWHMAARKIIPVQLGRHLMGQQPLDKVIDWSRWRQQSEVMEFLGYEHYA